MKTFSVQGVYKVLAVGIVGVLFAAAYFANPSFLKVPRAESAPVTSPNVSGWVWSLGTGSGAADSAAGPYSTTAGSNPGLGWISFNSTSDASSQAYGMKVDTTTKGTGGLGNFSGNAWVGDMDPATAPGGSNTGWVSFDRTEANSPLSAWGDPGLSKAGTPLAYVDWSTGNVYGWMRVLSACQNDNWDSLNKKCKSASAGDLAGGWDGWIKLSGTATDGSPYGVKISANKFSGKAWGGEVVGWVDFAPKIGGVSVGPVVGAPPCAATDPSISWGSCQALPSSTCVAPLVTKFFLGGGIRVGACPSGGTTTGPCDVTVACTPATGGTAPSAGCLLGVSNGICEAGENPLNCPKDCKVKYKQF